MRPDDNSSSANGSQSTPQSSGISNSGAATIFGEFANIVANSMMYQDQKFDRHAEIARQEKREDSSIQRQVQQSLAAGVDPRTNGQQTSPVQSQNVPLVQRPVVDMASSLGSAFASDQTNRLGWAELQNNIQANEWSDVNNQFNTFTSTIDKGIKNADENLRFYRQRQNELIKTVGMHLEGGDESAKKTITETQTLERILLGDTSHSATNWRIGGRVGVGYGRSNETGDNTRNGSINRHGKDSSTRTGKKSHDEVDNMTGKSDETRDVMRHTNEDKDRYKTKEFKEMGDDVKIPNVDHDHIKTDGAYTEVHSIMGREDELHHRNGWENINEAIDKATDLSEEAKDFARSIVKKFSISVDGEVNGYYDSSKFDESTIQSINDEIHRRTTENLTKNWSKSSKYDDDTVRALADEIVENGDYIYTYEEERDYYQEMQRQMIDNLYEYNDNVRRKYTKPHYWRNGRKSNYLPLTRRSTND